MHKKIIKIIFTILLFSVGFISVGSATNLNIESMSKIAPSSPDSNYGSDNSLRVGWNGDMIIMELPIYNQDVYLHMYAGADGDYWPSGTIDFKINSTTSFDENTVTWNNASLGTLIEEFSTTAEGWINISIANAPQFIIISLKTDSTSYVAYWSDDSGASIPYIEYSSSSAPSITSFSNTQTSDSSTSFFVNSSQSVTFNVTISQPIDTYTWYLDDVALGNQWETNASIDDKIIALDYQPHTVKMNATNTNGTVWQNWTINAGRTLSYESLQVVPSTITQGQSTTVTAWITNYSDTSTANVTITSPSSSTITLSLPYTGSDLFSGSFSQTNEAGRYYVTHTTIDGITKTNGLVYPFIIERLPTESTGSSSNGGNNNNNNANEENNDNDNTNDELNNLDDTFIQSLPPVFQEFINNIPSPIKQTISYIITPSLYIFDIFFVFLIVILLTVLANYEVTIEETVFFTLALFIILRLIGVNLTSILTGLT